MAARVPVRTPILFGKSHEVGVAVPGDVLPVIAGDIGHHEHLHRREAWQLGVRQEVEGMLVVPLVGDEPPDVVEEGGGQEESTVGLPQAVKALQLIEKGEGETGHLKTVRLIEHEPAPEGDGGLRELVLLAGLVAGGGEPLVHQVQEDPLLHPHAGHQDRVDLGQRASWW
jgi:hypothetical protein